VVSLTHDDKPVTGKGVACFEERSTGLHMLDDVKALSLHVGSRHARLTATVTRVHHAAEVHYDDVVLGPINGDPGLHDGVPDPLPSEPPPAPVPEMPMSEFAVVNESNGRVRDADVKTICEALSMQLAEFCAVWGYAVPVVAFYPAGAVPPSTSWVVSLVDQPDVDGALAYHSDDDAGRPDAFVFAGFIQDNGGGVLTGANSVAGATSHEVLELLRDQACTLWVEMPLVGPDGNRYARVAAEVCDPVQSGVDTHVVPGGARVDLSAYVFPAWEDPLDSEGPFSSDGSLAHSGDVAPGGYAAYEDASGNLVQVMAEGFPEHLRRLKATRGRAGKRMLAAPKEWAPVESTAQDPFPQVGEPGSAEG